MFLDEGGVFVVVVPLLPSSLSCTVCYPWRYPQVDCWRERVSNVSELDSLIQVYPVLLSYSLDTSVSRIDFLVQVNK